MGRKITRTPRANPGEQKSRKGPPFSGPGRQGDEEETEKDRPGDTGQLTLIVDEDPVCRYPQSGEQAGGNPEESPGQAEGQKPASQPQRELEQAGPERSQAEDPVNQAQEKGITRRTVIRVSVDLGVLAALEVRPVAGCHPSRPINVVGGIKPGIGEIGGITDLCQITETEKYPQQYNRPQNIGDGVALSHYFHITVSYCSSRFCQNFPFVLYLFVFSGAG